MKHKAIKALSVLILLLIAINVIIYKKYIDENNLVKQILEIVKEHEIDQLKANSMWFKAGCEASIDAMTQASQDRGGNADLELSLMIYKMSCETTAQAVHQELINKRAAQLIEKDSPAEE